MNLLRKSSMILLGTAMAGLLAFACAENDGVGSDSSEINGAAAIATDLVISQVYGGGGNGSSKDGDFVELFNPTKDAIKLSGMVLQTQARKKTGFDKTKFIELGDATIEPGHYFLVAFNEGKTFGADKKPADLVLKSNGSDLIMGGAAVALVSKDKLCDETCDDARDLVGYGFADEDKAMPSQHLSGLAPTPSSPKSAVLRGGNGCYDSAMNEADFTTAVPTPRTSADSFDCATLVVVATPDAGNAVDAGEPEPEADASADETDAGSADASTPKTDAGSPPKKDAGTAPPKKDAGATSGSDDDDTAEPDTAPAPTTGTKKKASTANTPPQPIAASSPSCSTTSGPASTGGYAGLAGLGLALAAFGRRKNRK